MVSMTEKGLNLGIELSKIQETVFLKSGLKELEFKRIMNELNNLTDHFETKEMVPQKKIGNVT